MRGEPPRYTCGMILWRISVNSLLAVIAAACVTMAAFRFHPAVGAFSFGAFLMGGARFHQLRRLDESYALGLRTMKDLNRLGVSIAAAKRRRLPIASLRPAN